MNVDWELFRIQKEYLVAMASDEDRLTEEVAVLDGVIHFMDAYQDENKPFDIDEDDDGDGTEDHDTDDRNPNRNGIQGG